MHLTAVFKNTKPNTSFDEISLSLLSKTVPELLKSWLSKVGSPSSRIDRTSFSNEKEISKLDFSGFSTRY
ncbi:PREDICTED: acylphosphatase-2-like [Apaloderma vittatum]|uniref:acylphosphatase-2-like n=1 Tax=Apaloderma vittatum TaxID=57397 RepID=UPI000521A362|nr:PREDICTED: acylphosphatase-2-like [Apaloderma vittatum]